MKLRKIRSFKSEAIYTCLIFMLTMCFGCKESPGKQYSLEKIISVGGVEDGSIYLLRGLVADQENDVFVLDSMDCTVKRFDSNGVLEKKTGKRGQGPGEFMAPVIIKAFENKIFVYDTALTCIHVLDRDLTYLRRIKIPVPLLDFEIISEKKYLIHSIVLNQPPKIIPFDVDSEFTLSSPLAENAENLLFSGIKFEIDSENNIYVCHLFEDRIEKYDKSFSLIWESRMLGGVRAKSENMDRVSRLGSVPVEMIYKDIEIDQKGFVYVLKGHVEPNRSREVYVLDGDNGALMGSFVLPEASHFIHVDYHSLLYSLSHEGTGYAVYSIKK